jgi:nucleoside-diphosphate-sugar epimerase
MRIVVFGAGGFVGGSICEELAELNQFEVLACVRRWASAVRLARRGIAITQCDLDDATGVVRAVAGAHVVVNAAMLPPGVEADLCRQLYSACAKVGVQKLIQFSSAAVYGNRRGWINEDHAPAPNSDYSRGKVRMEMALLAAPASPTPQLFILRPSIIYGPFADAWSVRYAQRIADGHWLSLGRAGSGTCNLIHVRDLVRFVILAANVEPVEKSHVLNLNGPDIISWNEYIERFGDALNITDRTTPNYAVFQTLALAAESIRLGGKWVKKQHNDLIESISHSTGTAYSMMLRAKFLTTLYPTLNELHLLRRHAHYSAKRATDLFGFRPAIALDEGLRETANWCKVHGIV